MVYTADEVEYKTDEVVCTADEVVCTDDEVVLMKWYVQLMLRLLLESPVWETHIQTYECRSEAEHRYVF